MAEPGRLPTRYAGPERSPGFLLWQVTNRWQAALRAALRPHDLTHVQFVLLAWLTWAAPEEPVTQLELARATALDKMMTSQVLRTLEHKGLVARVTAPQDKRARLVSATPAGRGLAARANAAVESCDASFFGALAEQDAALVPLLQQLSARGPDRR